MNSALQFSARPGDLKTPAGAAGGGRLPKGLGAKLAKEMGFEEYAQEAEAKLRELDELAGSNPQAYAKYMAQILAGGPEGDFPTAAPKCLQPLSHFCIECKLSASKSVRVQEAGKERSTFLNFVSHKSVEAPKMPSGDEASSPASVVQASNGMSIPLLIGQLRDLCGERVHGHDFSVDILVNPLVAEAAMVDYGFKTGLVSLAIQWVQSERKLELSRTWREVEELKYIGGRDGSDRALPFTVESEPSNGKISPEVQEEEQVRVTMSDPLKLLGAVQKRGEGDGAEEYKEKEKAFTMKLPFSGAVMPGSGNSQVKCGPLISEVIAPPASVHGGQASSRMDGKERDCAAVKKGFLIKKGSKKTAALYPEGSNEGSIKEGAYSRLMSRCKVVDTSTLSHEQQQAVLCDYAGDRPVNSGAQSLPGPNTTDNQETEQGNFNWIERGFLSKSTAHKSNAQNCEEKGAVKERKINPIDSAKFNEMLAKADPALVSSPSLPLATEDDDVLGKALSELAKVLGNDPSQSQPLVAGEAAAAQPRSPQQSDSKRMPGYGTSKSSELSSSNLAVHAKEGRAFVELSLSESMLKEPSLLELEAKGSALKIRYGNGIPLSVNIPFVIDTASMTAKLNRKRENLTISLRAL